MVTRELLVTVEATTDETAAEMVEALARAACNVANSTDDDEARIWVESAT